MKGDGIKELRLPERKELVDCIGHPKTHLLGWSFRPSI